MTRAPHSRLGAPEVRKDNSAVAERKTGRFTLQDLILGQLSSSGTQAELASEVGLFILSNTQLRQIKVDKSR